MLPPDDTDCPNCRALLDALHRETAAREAAESRRALDGWTVIDRLDALMPADIPPGSVEVRLHALVAAYSELREDFTVMDAERARLEREVARLDPPRGACGYAHHHRDCDCGGVGGDR